MIVGQQQRIQDAIALGQMAADADAAGLFAANQDVALQHEVADVLEADAAFVQLAAILRAMRSIMRVVLKARTTSPGHACASAATRE